MIRINLLPTAKRKRAKATRTASGGKIGFVLVSMGIAWLALAGAGYYKLDVMATEALAIRADAKKAKERAEEIRKLIDDDRIVAAEFELQ